MSKTQKEQGRLCRIVLLVYLNGCLLHGDLYKKEMILHFGAGV
jgi:hypothetical protein